MLNYCKAKKETSNLIDTIRDSSVGERTTVRLSEYIPELLLELLVGNAG